MKITFSPKNIFINFSIFLITLQSLWYYVPVVSLFGSILLILFAIFLLIETGSLSTKSFFFISWRTGLFFLTLTFFGLIISYLEITEIKFSRLLSFLLIPLLCEAIIRIGFDIIKTIKFSIKLHVLSFYVQFVCFYIFGITIDFVNMIFPHLESRMQGLTIFSRHIQRFCGFYDEPGTYVTFVSILTITILSINKDSIKGVFLLLILLSMFLSLSSYGFIFGFIFLLIYFKEQIRNIFQSINLKKISFRKASSYNLIKLIFISLIIIFFSYFIFEYISVRYFRMDHGGNFNPSGTLMSERGVDYRIQNINKIYDEFFNPFMFFKTFFGLSIIQGTNYSIALVTYAHNDMGLIIYMFMYSGLSGTLIFIFWLFQIKPASWIIWLLFIFILFSSKFSITFLTIAILAASFEKNKYLQINSSSNQGDFLK